MTYPHTGDKIMILNSYCGLFDAGVILRTLDPSIRTITLNRSALKLATNKMLTTALELVPLMMPTMLLTIAILLSVYQQRMWQSSETLVINHQVAPLAVLNLGDRSPPKCAMNTRGTVGVCFPGFGTALGCVKVTQPQMVAKHSCPQCCPDRQRGRQ